MVKTVFFSTQHDCILFSIITKRQNIQLNIPSLIYIIDFSLVRVHADLYAKAFTSTLYLDVDYV